MPFVSFVNLKLRKLQEKDICRQICGTCKILTPRDLGVSVFSQFNTFCGTEIHSDTREKMNTCALPTII